MIYSGNVNETVIGLENRNFEDKPIVFENQIGFPYHDLQPRDFERLIYCIFQQDILDNRIKNYDEIQLMQGVGERGRDSVLLKKGEPVGVIQCKRYKNNIDVSEVGKEIVKFILHYIQDKSLIADIDEFTYIFAVSYGFSEKALNLINSLSSSTYNKNEVETWMKEIINKTVSLKNLIVDDIKDTIFESLSKIKFIKLSPENLNMRIENYPEIKKMFFQMKSTIDIRSFENLLLDREKKQIEFLFKSSSLERVLEERNKYLYSELQKTKSIVQDLINEFSANFVLYSYHNKKHTVNLTKILGEKLFDQTILNELNEKELYVLSTASYLTDIGVCVPNNEIEEVYHQYLENEGNYRKLDIYQYIRNQHSFLTFDFIMKNWELLNLECELKDAIALVAGDSIDTNIFDYDYFEYSPDGGRYKVCIPYLYAHLKIADMIDIENLNSNYLLRGYDDMEEYTLSKKLWEETNSSVKAIVKNEDRLVFSGTINDQLIFISFNRHVEEIKRLYEQLITEIRKFRYNAKFNIYFIEEDFNTAFNKRLGFSIDYKGIAETLIGKNIYKDKFDGLREVIQNSIDSCSYKQTKLENYEPLIEVELTENILIIKDNGLGMDEYIIRNYFSKLCKSYYKEHGLDAIGQFGIGVFSYFMLCESFTLETRVKNGDLIKFKAYKNLYSYFYLYDEENSRLDEGTIISLHLKDDVLKELDFNELVRIIRTYFIFLNIPIKVNYMEQEFLIKKAPFELNVEDELINEINYNHLHKLNDLIFLESYIDNDLYEGISGLIFENSSEFKFNPIYLRDIIDDYFLSRGDENSLLICQKGVKITSEGIRFRYHGTILKNLWCKINLKTNLPLNLGRSEFQDSKLVSIINQFEVDLLSKFFNNIHSLKSREAYLLNSKFVKYYMDKFRVSSIIEKFVLDNFYISVFKEYGTDYLILSKFLSNNDQFILTGGNTKHKTKLSAKTSNPIVYIEEDDFIDFYFKYFQQMGYVMALTEDKFLLLNKCKEKKNDTKVFYTESIPLNNNFLFEEVKTISYGKTFYNFNHPLIQFYTANKNHFEKDSNLENKIKRLFNYLTSVVMGYEKSQISLKKTNEILKEILMPFNEMIQISINDFPIEFRGNIVD